LSAAKSEKSRAAPPKSSSDSPLFKADSATLTFSATDGGKMRVVYGGWDDHKVVLPGQVFELRRGPQGVEARIITPPCPQREGGGPRLREGGSPTIMTPAQESHQARHRRNDAGNYETRAKPEIGRGFAASRGGQRDFDLFGQRRGQNPGALPQLGRPQGRAARPCVRAPARPARGRGANHHPPVRKGRGGPRPREGGVPNNHDPCPGGPRLHRITTCSRRSSPPILPFLSFRVLYCRSRYRHLRRLRPKRSSLESRRPLFRNRRS
jgi:hypothetical protein